MTDDPVHVVEFDEVFDLSAYKGQLFDAKPVKLTYTLFLPIDSDSPAGKAAATVMEKAWRTKMTAWKKAKEKEYVAVLKETEKQVVASSKKKGREFLKEANGDRNAASKKLVAWIDEQGEIAAGLLRNAIATFKHLIEKTAFELWEKLRAKLGDKLDAKALKRQVKAVLKIVGMSIVVVAAAALTIAGAVLAALAAPTGIGLVAGLGIAATGVIGTVGAITKILDIAGSSWPDHKNAAKKLDHALQKLDEALKYQTLKERRTGANRKLGTKETVKLALTNIEGKKKAVREAAKQLEFYTDKMTLEMAKAEKLEGELLEKVREMEQQLAGADPSDKKAKKLAEAIKKGREKLDKYHEAQVTAMTYLGYYRELVEETEALLSEANTSQAKLGVVIDKLDHITHSKAFDMVITLGKGLADFFKGFFRLVGASS